MLWYKYDRANIVQLTSMLFIILFQIIVHIASSTPDAEIKLVPSESVYADTFDDTVQNKSSMILFWSSDNQDSKMYKTSKWDMLASEIHKHVRSTQVTVANLDCGDARNQDFCNTFDAFDTTSLVYPFIGISHSNESYAKYEGSMEYPVLVDFVQEHFERDCVYNRKWCTEKELNLIEQWKNMSLADQIKLHAHAMEVTTKIIEEFQNWTKLTKDTIRNKTEEVQQVVNIRDTHANMLRSVIAEQSDEAINQTLSLMIANATSTHNATSALNDTGTDTDTDAPTKEEL